jgi:hypothetical protein
MGNIVVAIHQHGFAGGTLGNPFQKILLGMKNKEAINEYTKDNS